MLKAGTKPVIRTPTFMAVLFTAAERWSDPSIHQCGPWVNQMWSMHAVEYYSALKRKEILV